MAYQERRIKINAFKQTKNPNINGTKCAFNDNHFIDYLEECFIHPQLRIIVCKKCRFIKEKETTSKFHNIPQQYDGHTYHSTFEVEYAKQLDLKLKTGLIKNWERQVKIEINVKYIDDMPVLTSEPVAELKNKGIEAYHITNYFMDFVVTNNDDSLTFCEVKGAELSVWKLKYRLTEMIYRHKVNLEVIKKQGYKPKKKKTD